MTDFGELALEGLGPAGKLLLSTSTSYRGLLHAGALALLMVRCTSANEGY